MYVADPNFMYYTLLRRDTIPYLPSYEKKNKTINKWCKFFIGSFIHTSAH